MLHDTAFYAREMVRERVAKIRAKGEENHLRLSSDFYAVLSDAFGADFTIAPGAAHEGTTFTGTWIDKQKRAKNQPGVPAEKAAAELILSYYATNIRVVYRPYLRAERF